MSDRLSRYQPQALAVLRIVTALLFVHGGMVLLFNLPPPPAPIPPELHTVMLIAGVLELVGGILVLLGFLTRPVAFILSGFMAVAYWGFHFPMSPWPAVNMGIPPILFCFIYLYLVFAGPGAWSVDASRRA